MLHSCSVVYPHSTENKIDNIHKNEALISQKIVCKFVSKMLKYRTSFHLGRDNRGALQVILYLVVLIILIPKTK